MTRPVFPSALNIHTPVLDTKVLRWGWTAGLFDSPSELERGRIQKINWFAAYLFPIEKPESLELIMRFFLCLFLLDDLLDTCPESDVTPFLKGIKVRNPQTGHPRLNALGIALIQTHASLGNRGPSQIWAHQWIETWQDYISGLQWEATNKFTNRMPRLEDYRIHRPSGSGVFLAIHLLRRDAHPDCCEAELLENDIARFICLSNDLVSYEKELAIGDFHNELIILREFAGGNVQHWADREIRFIQKRILALGKHVGSKSDSCQRWVGRLFLLVGGCLSWSKETSRYVAYINGTLKKF